MPTVARVFALMLFLAAIGTTAGCNTMEGLGEDIQALGQSVQGSAERNNGDGD